MARARTNESAETTETAVLLVEEHSQNALKVADSLAFMELGNIVWSGRRQDADMELLSSAYLGSSVTSPS